MFGPYTCLSVSLFSLIITLYLVYQQYGTAAVITMVLTSTALIAGSTYLFAQSRQQVESDLLLEKTKVEKENLERNLIKVYETLRKNKVQTNSGPPAPELPGQHKQHVEEEDHEGKPYM